MTAFFVATVKVKDPQKFQEYAQRAAATFADHGGEIILRGKTESARAGSAGYGAIGIVKFPNMDALTAWFKSKEYQAIIPLRKKAADMTIVAYSVPS